MKKSKKQVRKICLLTTPRSGSTALLVNVLRVSLRATVDCDNLDEYLSSRQSFGLYDGGHISSVSTGKADLTPGLVDRKISALAVNPYSYVFKVFPGDIFHDVEDDMKLRCGEDRLAKLGKFCEFVVLRRKDKVRQIASNFVCEKRDQWHQFEQRPLTAPTNSYVMPQSYAANWFWTNVTAFEHLAGLVKADHVYEYEQIADDMNMVSDEIGLPRIEKAPVVQKTDIDWTNYVENIDEVRDWFNLWSDDTKKR